MRTSRFSLLVLFLMSLTVPLHDLHAGKKMWIAAGISCAVGIAHYYTGGPRYTTKQFEEERGGFGCRNYCFGDNGPCAQQKDALTPLPDYHWQDLLLSEKERDAKLAPLVALAQQVGATPNPLQPIKEMACEPQCDRCNDLATVINVHSIIYLTGRVQLNAAELVAMGLLKPDQAKRIIEQVDGKIPEWLEKEDSSPKVNSLLERIEGYHSALRG